jgi:Tfp pilus assembly protein FimV
MQRVQHPSAKERSKKKWWPWIAAACVAGFMMVYLTPPKDTTMGTDTNQEVAVKVEPRQTEPQQVIQQNIILPETPAKEAPKQIAQSTPAKPKTQQTPVDAEPQIAQETVPAETVSIETLKAETMKAETPAIAQVATTTLTERDVPITRPENLKYTPEEMALMKKQANEAYLKWVELELEIAKYHLEQTAQK